jgi:hypothetical protein
MIDVVRQKKDLVDISFMPEDMLYLDSLAKENKSTVVVDCESPECRINCGVSKRENENR